MPNMGANVLVLLPLRVLYTEVSVWVFFKLCDLCVSA